MIFHKRDQHVIELQQSDQKALMPDEACTLSDTSTMPYTTLISSSLRQRKCPNPGRYVVLGLAPFHLSSTPFRRQRRNERRSSRIIKRRTWNEDTQQKAHEQQKHHHHHHHHHREHGELQQQQQERHGEDCRSANVQIGCTLPNQSEIIIEKTCDREETTYYCHGSWEERGTWYTIVSQKPDQSLPGVGQTLCLSMRSNSNAAKSSSVERALRSKVSAQEVWFTRLDRVCRREPTEDEWPYRLVSQGVCEDVTKAASSLASLFVLSRFSVIVIIGNCAMYKYLLR